MPKVKWCVQPPPPKYIAETFKRYEKACGYKSKDLAEKVGLSPDSVRKRLTQSDEKWTVEWIITFGKALNVDADELGLALYLAVQRGINSQIWWRKRQEKSKQAEK